ncbi:MAG: hypothetical protein ACRDT9_10645, partial [Agromyces sp.]
NVGNAVHSAYVFSLPFGPIWVLHGFYLIASALMLVWFLRYRGGLRGASRRRRGSLGHATERADEAVGPSRRMVPGATS